MTKMDSCLLGSGDKPSIFSSSCGSPLRKCGKDNARGIPEIEREETLRNVFGAWTELTEGERYLRLQKNRFETKSFRKVIILLSRVIDLWAGREIFLSGHSAYCLIFIIH